MNRYNVLILAENQENGSEIIKKQYSLDGIKRRRYYIYQEA